MNPLIIVLIVVAVASAVVGLATFVFRDSGGTRAADRLDTLVGKRNKESAADILLKQSHRESDKRTLLDVLTPNILSLQRIFEQADCHIKASTLFGVGLGLAVVFMSLSWLATKS